MQRLLAAIMFMLALCCGITEAQNVAIVPTPHRISMRPGNFAVSANTKIMFATRETDLPLQASLEPLANVFAGEIEMMTGHKPKVISLPLNFEPSDGEIVLRFAPTKEPLVGDEADEDHSYRLVVAPNSVIVEAPYFKGVAHGTASLIQAIKDSKLPAMEIVDAPKDDYRSVMIDVARQVHSIGVIQDVIRLVRLYKLRYVHLHLTDDQNFTFPFEPVTSKLKKNFAYSRQELLDLVKYADARGVTLIPELDLPGHSTRLRQSGYLNPGKNDADVADLKNISKITAIIDDMLEVFSSSPYFHIGGDESGAREKLVPFLAAINQHLRRTEGDKKKRLIVWEGFRGAPKSLPATGEDRIIVMAWESSYNAPWDLLENEYTIINSSWKPTYIVGGGGLTYAHNSGGRKFSMEDLYRWSKSRFMHWEAGRPIYNDRGPGDPNQDDGEWDATWIEKDERILGGQMQFWEQSESVVIERLSTRLAVAAERLWNSSNVPFSEFKNVLDTVHPRVMTIVQPVEVVLPEATVQRSPVRDFYFPYQGQSMKLQFRNRTKIKGTIRYNEGGFRDELQCFGFSNLPHVDKSSKIYESPIEKEGGFIVRASLVREDGTPVAGSTWARFNNWPNRVSVTDYDVGRRTPKTAIDLARLADDKIISRHATPMLRGPINATFIRSQMLQSVFVAPGDGEYELSMKSTSGTASLYFDQNRNRKFEPDEKLIANTPTNEQRLTAKVELEKGQRYGLRVDHMINMPRLVLIVGLEGPGLNQRTDISKFLELPQ